jgi:ATP-dependent Clp protease ATP-binding subunit ClpC
LEARLTKSPEADTEHVLLAMLKEKNTQINEMLITQCKLDYPTTLMYVKSIIDNQSKTEKTDKMPQAGANFVEEDEEMNDKSSKSSSGGSSSASGQKTASQKKEPQSDTPVLDNFGTDITQAAIDKKLDPIIGRDKEIERIAQILSRRKKK